MKYFITFAVIIFGVSHLQAQTHLCDPSFYAQGVTAYRVHTEVEVNGQDPNQKCFDEEGRETTPLHIAVESTQNEQALHALIMKDANLLAVNEAGQTPYEVLLEMEYEQYGKLQQANRRWENLVKNEYEEAQRRINQKIQDSTRSDEIEDVSREITEAWSQLGGTPVEEAQARFDQIHSALSVLRLFTDLSWAIGGPARDTYTPVIVNADYDEKRDIQEFLRFVNGKLALLGIEPLVTPHLTGNQVSLSQDDQEQVADSASDVSSPDEYTDPQSQRSPMK